MVLRTAQFQIGSEIVAVHYLMGHGEKKHGEFRIPLNGEEIELKIDYGETYEKVRLEQDISLPRFTFYLELMPNFCC
jgi:hypothetical protein